MVIYLKGFIIVWVKKSVFENEVVVVGFISMKYGYIRFVILFG